MPELFVPVIVRVTGKEASIASRVGRDRPSDGERWFGPAGEHLSIPRAPLSQAGELAHAQPDRERRDDEGPHERAPVPPLERHYPVARTRASFSARDKRRNAASRRSGPARAGC